MLGCSVAAASRNPPSDGVQAPARPPTARKPRPPGPGSQEAPPAGERPRWARWGPGLGCVWSGSGIQSPHAFSPGSILSPCSARTHPNILARALCLLPLWLAFFFFFSGPALLSLFLLSSHLRHCHPGAYLSSFFACVPFAALPKPWDRVAPYPALPNFQLHPSEKDRVVPVLLIRRSPPSLPHVTKPTVHLPRPWEPTSPTRNLNPSPNASSRRRQLTSPCLTPRISTRSTGSYSPPNSLRPNEAPRRPQLAPATLCSSIVCCPVNTVTSHPSPVRQRTIHTL